jgi:proline dehydrogenase
MRATRIFTEFIIHESRINESRINKSTNNEYMAIQETPAAPQASTLPVVDLFNTEHAFAHLSDSELKKSMWMFRMMNNRWLVRYGSRVGLWAVENSLPFAEMAVRNTIFEQFVGGATLLESQPNIDRLAAHQVLTILDYGAEAKSSENDFNLTMNENLRAIDFASRSAYIPIISTKITGLARFELLERIQAAVELTKAEQSEYRNVLKRIDAICHHAAQKGVAVFIDAEETWIQDSIDHLVWLMMKRYNRNRVVVYNTFQLYRTDRLQFLTESFDRARRYNFILGAKLVRGAYMEKEAARAAEMGYPNPINPSKQATDDHYNTALRFCIDNIEHIALCNASHNAESVRLQVELMDQKGIVRNHPHALFSQLFGMSDNLTFNLAHAGFRVAKYLPYGQVIEVIPYLIRRAQENSAVSGDMSRELSFILTEVRRRGL